MWRHHQSVDVLSLSDRHLFKPDERSSGTDSNWPASSTGQHGLSFSDSAYETFIRRVVVPPIVDLSHFTSRLTSDGILTVEAPVFSQEVVDMMMTSPTTTLTSSQADIRRHVARLRADNGGHGGRGATVMALNEKTGDDDCSLSASSSTRNYDVVEIGLCDLDDTICRATFRLVRAVRIRQIVIFIF